MSRFPPPNIETERLRLRTPVAHDAVEIFRTYASDPDVSRYMQWPTSRSVEETRAFLHDAVKTWVNGEGHRPWVIERRETGVLLGMIGAEVTPHGVTFGYALGQSHWGKGIAVEAVLGLCGAAFADPSIHRMWAWCDVDNHRSARVLEKAGFEFEGILRKFTPSPNFSPNSPRDCRSYAKVR